MPNEKAFFIGGIVSLFLAVPVLDAEIIIAEEASFSPPEAQPLFPAGNLNVFKQFVLGFEAEESVGETVEVDLLLTTLEFGGQLDVGIGAFFGLEFGLCLGGGADFDMGFQPVVILPDVYPSEVPIAINVTEGLMSSSNFTTYFPSAGEMYADLILELTAGLKAEACVFDCFTPIDFDFNNCREFPNLFKYSTRCDLSLDQRAYCAIELASFNRQGNNKVRFINVSAKTAVEFLAEPHKEYGGMPTANVGGYGSITIAAPTISTDSNDSMFNTDQVLKSSGSENVMSIDIDLARMITDIMLPSPLPPLSNSGDIGPIEWDYTIASLEAGPAVKLQMDFEVTWDLVITNMKFTDPATGQPKAVRLFTPPSSTYQIDGDTVTDLPVAARGGAFHLTNTGAFALPMISLITDDFSVVTDPNVQSKVKVEITYELAPKLMTVVSLPIIGQMKYEVLSAGASIDRIGDLRIGPLLEGEHRFKFGEFEVYRGAPRGMASVGTGVIEFEMQSAGPPRFDWNPSQWTGSPTNNFLWTGLTTSNPLLSNWQVINSDPTIRSSYPGQGGPNSYAQIIDGPASNLDSSQEIASLKTGKFGGLTLVSDTQTELTVSGLLDNSGYIVVERGSSLWMNTPDAILFGDGLVSLRHGGVIRGDPDARPASFVNYNTITGAGQVMDDYIRFENRTYTRNMGQINANGNSSNGSTQFNFNLVADSYPEDITWTLHDLAGNLISQGGPYTAANSAIKVTLNLSEGNYIFAIEDDFEDGICCGEGEGSYTLTDGTGRILAQSDGAYGAGEEWEFSLFSGSYLKTAAYKIVNEGKLGAEANGRLVVDANDQINLMGSTILANDGRINLRSRFVEHTGNLRATNHGRVVLTPFDPSSRLYWAAGQSFRADCGGFCADNSGILEINKTDMDGGCFTLSSSASLIATESTFLGSVFRIGSTTDKTPIMKIDGIAQEFNRSYVDIFGTLRVSGKADFRDSILFANHGTLEVAQGGELRIHENTIATPGAAEDSRTEPGLDNATATTLLGGKWDIAGKLYINGANFTSIGADVASATTDSGSRNQLALDGQPPESDIVTQEEPTHLLSGGSPAEVTLRGTFAQFLALNSLIENNGTLNLVEGADFRPNGTFTNNGQLYMDTGSVFEPKETFIQSRPDATTFLEVGGLLRPQNQTYDISGGTLTALRIDSVFNTFGNKIKTGATIRIASPIVDTNEAIYRLEKVVIDIPTIIEEIDVGSVVTLHGSAIEFPALTDNLTTNLGTLILSGGGVQNPSNLRMQDDFNEELLNRGQLEVLGFTSELSTNNYTQLGSSSVTRIGAGARLGVNSIINIQAGKIIFEIGSRPHQEYYGSITGQPYEAHFNDLIVVDFVGELAETKNSVDIGDTWDLMANQPLSIDGIDQVTFLVDGKAPEADWLPANSHLELLQFETPHGPRGLRVRVVPDAGFLTYDQWAANASLDPNSFLADPYSDTVNPGIINLKDYIYGSSAGAEVDITYVTVVENGIEHKYTKFSFLRPAGSDVSYNPYYSYDLIHWRRAPMTLLPGEAVAKGEMELVTMISTYPVDLDSIFYRIQPSINPDNFDYGEIPEKLIGEAPGSLNNFNQFLVNNSRVVSYLVEPGKTLFFNVQLPLNESRSGLWGGVDDNGELDYIYRDRSILELAVRHSGLLAPSDRGIIAVTFVDADGRDFNGAVRNGVQSNPLSAESVPYSYKVALFKKF